MRARIILVVVLIVVAAACKLFIPSSPAIPVSSALVYPAFTNTAEYSPTAVSSATQTLLLSPTPQPAWEWQRSTPEEQGLSSAVLAGMLETMAQEKWNIHSILVVRHGVLVLEVYNHPFNSETRHSVYSVTKSITSSLVGIALNDGLLDDVNTPVISFFPSVTLDDPRKGSILVEHLLSMSSGIEWMEPLYSGLNDHWGILEADDPAAYFFNPALLYEPGTVFNYNSGGSHMLSMIIQKATDIPAAEFAAEKLFAPLDITDYSWEKDFTGHSKGGTGLELKPQDMAKIGQLYLNGGRWLERVIIPAEWITQSTATHSIPYDGMGYGYQWWLRPQGDYYALGWGGQQIRVFPEQDMVAVFTAGMSGNSILHNDLVDNYILPAVISDSPLPADSQAQARLQLAIDALGVPQEWLSKPLPPLAKEIDGKQWLVTGQGNWSIFALHFEGNDEAQFELTIENDPMLLMIGLDGIYRVTDTEELGPVALAGYWDNTDTFVIIQQNLREADRRTTRMHFNGNNVKLFSEWIVEPYHEESEAVLFGE